MFDGMFNISSSDLPMAVSCWEDTSGSSLACMRSKRGVCASVVDVVVVLRSWWYAVVGIGPMLLIVSVMVVVLWRLVSCAGSGEVR